MKIARGFVGIGVALTLGLSGCGSSGGDFVATSHNTTQSALELFRTVDGSGNSADNAGMAGSLLLRRVAPAYADGLSRPAGAARLSAREISNLCAAQSTDMPDQQGRSDFVWAWGQFIDHDMDQTSSGGESMPIAIPSGDPSFDPGNTGTVLMPFTRSLFDAATGVTNARQQRDNITAFLDGSQVYGSDDARAAALRTFSGGLLATSPGDFPPFNVKGFPVDNPMGLDPATLFLCGDIRASEHLVLSTMHTIFLREHNFWARLLAAANPTWSDEQIYQRARKIVGAEIQAITYREFLPALLGPDPLPVYTGYKPNVNPGIDTTFSTAAYRIGHTMVGSQFLRLGTDGNPIAQGNVAVRDGFFQPQKLIGEGGVDPILRGLAAHRMQAIDTKIVDDLRNFLFGPPGAGGMDLAAMNIQRGRDHGLADYNTTRQAYGLPRVSRFSDITSDVTAQNQLSAAYASVDDIDLWVGLLAEDHVPGTATGPTHRAILIDQFTRLRDGDRFFYLNDPSLSQILPQLESTRLADIIFRNSDVQLQSNVFFVTP